MPRHICSIILFFVLSLAAVSDISAQPYCRVRTFDIHDGLPSNSIVGLVQSSDNLLWVPTWNGLCYYDGYQFMTFREGGENGTLSSKRLRNVEPDDNGHVWIFTYDRNLYVLDTHTGLYTNLSDVIAGITGKQFQGLNIYRAGDRMWINGKDSPMAVRVSIYAPASPDSIEVYDVSRHCDVSSQVHKIVVDDDGNEWVVADNCIHLYGSDVTCRGRFVDVKIMDGVAHLITEDGHMYVYNSRSESLRHMPVPEWVKKVNTVMAYDSRNLLLGTSDGIAVYNVPNRKWRRLAEGNVRQIYVDSQARLWVYTDAPGVMLTDIYGSTVETFTSAPEGSACTGSLRPLWLEDKYGVVWLVPTDGVFGYFDEDAGRIVPYPLESPRFGRTSIPAIEKFYVDSQHNLWVTSTHDLILINFSHYNVMRLPLVQNEETRSLVALADSSVLAGSYNGVIGWYGLDGSLKGYVGNGPKAWLSKTPVKFSDRIYTMLQDSRGRVWIGSKGDGLHVIDTDGTVVHYMPVKGDRYAINSDYIYDFDEGPSGRMLIATYGGGVNIVDDPQADVRKLRFINASNDLSKYPIDLYPNTRRVAHGLGGEVLLSTTGGLLTFSGNYSSPGEIEFYASNHVPGDATSLRTNDVMQVLVARDGSVYVSTMGGEMQRVVSSDLLQPGLKFASMPDGIADTGLTYTVPEGGAVMSMIEDGDGNICAVRETSIVLYDMDKGRITVYGPNDLGGSIEFTEASPELIDSTGSIWLPTVGGIVSFHPNDVTKSDYRPNIVFTGVQFQGESEMRHILNADRLDVEVDKRNLAISFAALDFSDNYLLQYAYKFDGDEEWNYLQGSHTIQLARLRPGHHRLLVKSTNSDGVWLDNEAGLDIYVHPSFSETPWAILLYVVIALLLGWGVIRYYFLRKKNDMLSDMRDKEAEFYSDVSHKLRTPLTLIGEPVREVLKSEPLSDTARGHLEKVERNSGRMLHLVDEMLRKSHDKGVYISDENVATPQLSPVDAESRPVPSETEPVAEVAGAHDPSKSTLLVVEDNDDLRSFLTDILSSQYNVIAASNGREGLKMAEKAQPDFILTDVTMPEMDGLTMVRNIKSNKMLSHIPIIVLSAKASEQDRVMGLREGIDDYVTKPFSATYLRQRIANIIAQRRMLQQSYLESLGSVGYENIAAEPDTVPEQAEKPADGGDTQPAAKEYRLDSPQVVDADKEMMATLMAFINEHIEEEGLKIEELAEAVNLGRTVFYGKIKALVGMTPSDFLRRMRMQRAEELIAKSRMNFSEIAFKVGFSDPKYFTKCFKKETGMTPSEYRQKSVQ